ncbi:MAG: hypothetical protein M1549_04240 [Candidatus Dependentiae bacterium]|nr:hypothetical protein [Candidatus Dependentiae bacterium]
MKKRSTALLLACFGSLLTPSILYPMEKEELPVSPEKNEKIEKNEKPKDKKKLHAHLLKQHKVELLKKDYDEIFKVIKGLEVDNFTKYEKNNTPYDQLVKKFYRLFLEHEGKKNGLPLNPEKLLCLVLTNQDIPDFAVHAILAHVGSTYTKEVTESDQITAPLESSQQQLTIPWPQKKCQIFVSDSIEQAPIFSQDASMLAILGKKSISVFSTVTGKRLRQCSKLIDGIQLLKFAPDRVKDSTICVHVKTPDGLADYELSKSCTDSTCIPSVYPLKKNEELEEEFKLNKKLNLEKTTISTNSSSTLGPKKKYLGTPRKTTHPGATTYCSLPKESVNIGSCLPPYTNRFCMIKHKIPGLIALAFLDLDLNKIFPPEKKEEFSQKQSPNVLDLQQKYSPFGLISENGLYGAISTTKKTIDLYGFTSMLPLPKWFFSFCLRYGNRKKTLNFSGSWCSAFYTFTQQEQAYLTETYTFGKPKKRNSFSQTTVPPLMLSALAKKDLFDSGPKTEPRG